MLVPAPDPLQVQPRRHMVILQFMSAARAILIRPPHRPEAIPATRRQLIIALRAKVKIALHMRSARVVNPPQESLIFFWSKAGVELLSERRNHDPWSLSS